MNKRHLVYKILLALLLTSSYVILSGHISSHTPSNTTTCVLCFSHGSAASAIPVAGTPIAVMPVTTGQYTPFYTAHLQMGFIAHNPARAPPISS